jgi:sugar lactone lactonase YvrE
VLRLATVAALALGAVSAWAQGLEYPVDVAVDAKGNVFVADHQAHALLKLEEGSFKVVAKGKGLPGTPLFGIRHIAPDNDSRWVVSDPATMKLYRIDDGGNVTPVPDDDGFVTPWGVAVESSGAILAVDRVTQRLRRIGTDGNVSDVAEIRAPKAILFDKQGLVLVLTDQNLVRVGNGSPPEPIIEDSPFEFAHDAVRHPNGNYYVTDGYAKAIWQVTPEGQTSALVQGAPLQSPQGLALDGEGNLLVADAQAKTIFKVNVKGEVSVLAQ